MQPPKLVINNRKNETDGEFYYEAECGYCHMPFKGHRSNIKYCSQHCRARFHYEKRKKAGKANPVSRKSTSPLDKGKKTNK